MKKLILFAISLWLLTLYGCYDYRELNDLAVVSGVSVNLGHGENRYSVTAEIINVRGSQSDTLPKPTVISAQAPTLTQAFDKISTISGNELYFGHTQILTLDSRLAKDGINSIADFVARTNEMRLSMYFVITRDTGDKSVFEHNGDGGVRALNLSNSILANSKIALCPNIPFYKFLSQTVQKGQDSYLPLISLTDTGDFDFLGTAIFRGGAMVAEVSPEHTPYLLFALDQQGLGSVNLVRDTHIDGDVSFQIINRTASVNARLTGGKVVVDISFSGEFSIAELFGQQELFPSDQVQELEGQLEKYVKQNFYNMVRLLRFNNRCDPLGLERQLLQRDPDLEPDLDSGWDTLYENAVFNIAVDCKITTTGRTSIRLKEEL